jgi:resuscitation-promoting factor RpfB
MGPSASGASGAAAAMEAIPNSHAVALLEQERQQLVVMSEASRTLTVVARPKLASPQSAESSSSDSSSSDSSSSGTSGSSTGTTVPVVAAPDPGTAKSIAYDMMSSFGFSPTAEFGCLDDLWTRESDWSYDAENPASGAYGIPQSLPGYKMASAGADWQTDPTTQIRWGLGYIQQVYGNPCSAWDFELANGYY